MDWERHEENLDREFTLYCNFTELELLSRGLEQLSNAFTEGQEIAGMGDLSDMD